MGDLLLLSDQSAPVRWRRIEKGELLLGFPDNDFEGFFLKSYDALVRSLSAITGSREVAQDCVQEAFLTAANQWRRVKKLDDPTAWVRRVAINKSRDVHRSETRRHRRETFVSEGARGDGDPGASVDGALDLAELLRSLPHQQRAVTALHYIDDLPVAEIAVALGISTGTVKFHLNQARKALRRRVGEVQQ